ncbi:MAG TPA: UvrD-helicase domain-containing protein [Bacilli bacterium]|nr:UvrD-helicase domain-containing protein [Bacilli bacterium]
MSRQPNKQQQLAIDAEGRNVIVSAGAGSGKTMVLTSRVIRLLEQGVSLNHMLVLTFTNAAAQEMKQRIRQRLLQLQRHDEAALVDGSRIMTFDAFSLSLVSKYHYVLGLDPNVGIIDEQVLALIRKKTIMAIFERRYAARDSKFVNLISSYAVRDDNVLQAYVAMIDKMADLKIDKKHYLNTYVSNHFSPAFIEAALSSYKDMFDRELDALISSCSHFIDEEMGTLINKDMQMLRGIDDLSLQMATISDYKFPRKITRLTDEDKAIHEAIKAQFKPLKTWASVGSVEQITTRYLETKEFVTTLIEIAQELDERLSEFKQLHQKFSFSDISKLAISLAQTETINRELKDEIRHIMIDEYQDTNDIQDYFISLLENNNVFMVGDIKQSIYRFRNANCDLFAKKYDDYAAGIDGLKIDMNINFRSRKQVLSSINRLFGRLMSREVGGADYAASHNIDYGNKETYDDRIDQSSDIGMRVYGYRTEADQTPTETEIHLIAQDIIKKMSSGHQIVAGAQMVTAGYQDFAILIDRRSSFADFKRIFHQYGIPLDVSINEDFHSDDVINVFKNLIKLVAGARRDDFPQKHVHELMSVWRSFLFEYTDEHIYQCVTNLDHCYDDPLIDKIKQLSVDVATTSLGQLVTKIALEFDLHKHTISLGDVLMHQAKIEQLIGLAESLEQLFFTLDDFVSYFEESELFNESPSFENPKTSGPAVRLLTIHKSKGLEFPIVYLPGLFKQFNRSESKTSFIASGKYGLILPLIDERNAYTMFHYLARRNEDEQSLSEEMRKFYVALTRTKELVVLFHNVIDDKPLLSLQKSASFRDFMRFSGLTEHLDLLKTSSTFKRENLNLEQADVPITFKHLHLSFDKQMATSASKMVTHASEMSMHYGTMLHEIFSQLHYKNLDLQFIEDSKIKQAIEATLALPPFNQANSANVYQEYSYYNPVNGMTGTIDLMLEFIDEIRIIDLKTGSIEDVDYDRQLRTYANYIKTVSDKPLKLYLVSLTRNTYRAVKDEE